MLSCKTHSSTDNNSGIKCCAYSLQCRAIFSRATDYSKIIQHQRANNSSHTDTLASILVCKTFSPENRKRFYTVFSPSANMFINSFRYLTHFSQCHRWRSNDLKIFRPAHSNAFELLSNVFRSPEMSLCGCRGHKALVNRPQSKRHYNGD